MEILISQQINNLLDGVQDKQSTISSIMEIVDGQVEDERDEAALDREREIEDRQKENMLFAALTTGKPDFFSDEMQWFWDNGRVGNV